MTISMPMKELPITTSFFPSFAAAEAVRDHPRRKWSRVDITCINLYGIIDGSEGENVLEVDTRNGQLLWLPSGRKDELIVVDKLFPSFQHDLLSGNVDRGDGLRIHPVVIQGITSGI